MTPITISDVRAFSLEGVQKGDLVKTTDVHVQLLCFEAGQRDKEESASKTTIYQVLEGEALVRQDGESVRLGKGKLLSVPAGHAHTLENAGGGLLVVMATRAL